MDKQNDAYVLKWSDFQTEFTEGFKDLRKEESMVDVTLAVDGRVLQAHKIVLSVCSPYFKDIFKINPCKHPVVFLYDVSHHVLSCLLDFMYQGEVGVLQDDLSAFLKLADALKVKGLTGEQIPRDDASFLLRKKRVDSQEIRRTLNTEGSSDSESDDEVESKPYSRRLARKRPKSNVKSPKKRKIKMEEVEIKDSCVERKVEEDDDDSDCCPLVKMIIGKQDIATSEGAEGRLAPPTTYSSADNDDGNDPVSDDFQMPGALFNSYNTSEPSDQGLQGGVDYQMIQTKRGRDMLLYDGYTFTQNRMCKDGMRWQCSHPKCKAFCRMSSAGWLTPYKNQHDHERPPDDDIRRRILRMELKARAQSSGATPGEIIRNALPADEYETTHQRACFTRCIQRYRKSLLSKSARHQRLWPRRTSSNPSGKGVIESEQWIAHPKPAKEEVKPPLVEGIWSTHPEPVQLSEEEKQRQLADQKDNTHAKIGAYEI